MSYPYKASCMAEIFPLSYRQPKNKKNFIKENIKKLKEVQSKSSESDSKISNHLNYKGAALFKSTVRSHNEFGLPSTDSHRKPLIEKQKLTKHAEQLIEKTRSEINCPKVSSTSTVKRSSDKECQTLDMEKLRLDRDETETVVSSARSIGLQTDIGDTQSSCDINKKSIKLKKKPSKNKQKIESRDKSSKEPLGSNKASTNSPSKSSVPESYQRGIVPRYIREKKIQQEQEEIEKKKIAQMLGTDDPDCPPGHVRLPEDKRKESLRQIKEKYDQLLQELNGLPVRSDSYRMKKHRIFLEKELEKMEAGLKLFSREKLFVKISS